LFTLSSFSFEFWMQSASPSGFTGDVIARVRLYDNYASGGQHAPGNLFYDSGDCNLRSFGLADLRRLHPGLNPTLGFSWQAGDFLQNFITIPTSDVFWDIEFTGLGSGDALGVNAVRIQLDQSPSPVPEPSTYLAGALALLPFGASALRSLRKRQLA
jgi:hypothetical protein